MRRAQTGLATIFASALLILPRIGRAVGDEYGKHDLALIQAMGKSKLTLAEGIAEAAKHREFVIEYMIHSNTRRVYGCRI